MFSLRTPLPNRHRLRRLLTVFTLAGLGLALGVGTASAHVTVNPGTATPGGYTKLTFRVPNESATAKTTKLVVTFPEDTPFASVSVAKVPGWTITPEKTTLPKPVAGAHNTTITQAVTKITWQADAQGAIGLGEFVEFDVSVGPVPDVKSISFPADQYYSDGTVVHWNQPTPASGEEPEHPAPTLLIDAAAPATSASAATSPTVTATDDTPAPTQVAAARADGAARVLAVIGIVVGALGLLVGAAAWRRRPAGR